MLDKKSYAVLKALNKLSEGTAYKVITAEDVLSNLTPKSQYDADGIKQIIEFLEKQEYLNIKFCEDNTYCYSLTPKARISLEQEGSKPKPKKNNKEILNFVFAMIASFIGTMLALIIFAYLPI